MLRTEEGNFDEVQNLLSGLRQIEINSINKKGYTALAIAVKNGYLEIVRILLSKGASVNTKNNVIIYIFTLIQLSSSPAKLPYFLHAGVITLI